MWNDDSSSPATGPPAGSAAGHTARGAAEAPRIQSLVRADAILSAIAARRDGIRLHELARAVALNKTTVFNLVGTLVRLGFARQDPATKAYSLEFRNLQLGRQAQRQQDFLELCAQSLHRLCVATRETVNLAVPYLDCAMIVDSREGGHTIRLTSYAGTLAPYHATACGKAILAFLDEPLRVAHYERRPLERLAPGTITSIERLEDDLATIRATRIAHDREEMEKGAHCVAVPIFDGFERVCGAISVAGVKDRMSDDAMAEIAALIAAEIARIERRLRLGSAA